MNTLIPLINQLAKNGRFEEIRYIREGYTRHLPIELIHTEDREICEYIDKLLKNKTDEYK